MEVNDEVLIDFKPLRVSWRIATLFLTTALIFAGAWILFFVLRGHDGQEWITHHVSFSMICFLILLLAFGAHFWFYDKVYIYKLIIKDGFVNIYWQEWNKFKEIKVPIASVNASLVPSGKDEPYLQLDILEATGAFTIEQSETGKWDRKVMESNIAKIESAKLASSS
jgi:hypothetical protein